MGSSAISQRQQYIEEIRGQVHRHLKEIEVWDQDRLPGG